jgi:hypothetical protein
LNTTPAIVVPVFHALGMGMPLDSINALRFTRLKSKPPALVPMTALKLRLQDADLVLGRIKLAARK